MNNMPADKDRRVLVIDDNRSIHDDFRKILSPDTAAAAALDVTETALFGRPTDAVRQTQFEVDSAYQGQEGVLLVKEALEAGRSYAVAFVDVRMPPGWNGIETTANIWKVDPDVQIVICTAYSDYSWDEMSASLGHSDQLVVLKKPFDTVEVLQLASALTAKWRLAQEVRRRLDTLEHMVEERTRELRASNETLRTLIHASPLAIIALDGEANVTAWNPAAERIFGWTEAEALGHTLPIVPADQQSHFRAMLDGQLRGEAQVGLDVRRQRKDGSLVDIRLWSASLHDADGNITGALGLLSDATERKQLEQRLLHAKKLEAVGRLAGGVAHDFNNILTAITGYSELLLRHLPDKGPQRGYASEIERAAYRAARLTRQLLAFSRRQVLQPRVLDLNTVVTELDKMLRQLIGENIELRTITAADLGSVKADPGQLEQVVVNLAVNARDAMPHGGVLILQTENVTVDEGGARPHPELLPGEYVVISVADTGIGMSEKTKAIIFEPFFSTKPKESGAGLGLATCYGIIKQSGGHITVESELNRGTTFKVFLPRVAEEPAESTARSRESSRPPSGGETLLVVEDEPAVRQLAASFLTELGYEVFSAGNGVEALQVVAERNGDGIDLVVTDVVMPRMGGMELADNLHLQHPDIKLLFTSGYTEDAIVRHGVLEADLTFIPKPYTSGALARKVREVLDGEPTV